MRVGAEHAIDDSHVGADQGEDENNYGDWADHKFVRFVVLLSGGTAPPTVYCYLHRLLARQTPAIIGEKLLRTCHSADVVEPAGARLEVLRISVRRLNSFLVRAVR
jgi:hypothetical protein